MDKSRQQFEEWRSKNKSSTINLFDVWQASRESLEVELPTKEPTPSQDNSYAFGYNRAITESIELLNRQGVKIKNEQ
ncbi:hypothetical protein [Providencia rustigianii]|uniref:hypothetical protein n=1 Tax=Providencia rustigianii TaxID=158850 RepID=UPI0038B2F964